ncbi:MAG TPA: ABC transporter permease, partial [Pyrinomonadaceae bacterium]
MISTGKELSSDVRAEETTAQVAASATDAKTTRGKRRGRRRIVYLQSVAFLIGLALLIYVVNLVGIQPIFDALGQIGYGFFLLLAIIGLRHVLRALAMRTAFAPEHRRFSLWQAFVARIGGEAVTFLTFTGPVLGEATKAAMLRKRAPLASGVQALVIDNLLYNLSVALFIASGACVLLAVYDLPDAARYPVIAIAVGMTTALVLVVAAVVHRMTPISAIVNRLIRLGFKRRYLMRRREHIHHVETNVYNFYRHRPAAFFAVAGLDFLSHCSSVVEVYAALYMLGFDSRLDVPYIIESLTKIINLIFGFVPATIGVYEGGNGFILHTLGYTFAVGTSLGLVRKAGIVVWTGLGLVALVWRAVPSAARRIVERHPHLKKAMDNLVLSNITHRPARTLVSVLGVAVGVLLVVFTVGLAHGILRERGRREASVGAEIIVRASGSLGLSGGQSLALDASRAEEIGRIEGVRVAVPIGQNTVESDSGFGMRIIDGVPLESYSKLSGLRMTEGRAFDRGDEAIVDSRWRDERKARVGDSVTLYDRPFRIVGIYEPPGGGRIKIPLSTMQEHVGSAESCTSILIACANPAEQDAVAERIHQAC